MQIKNLKDLNLALDVWTVSSTYPTYFITTDGGCICKECVIKHRRSVVDSIATETDDGWRVCGLDVNYENAIYCDHCNDRIESAYAEDEIVDWYQQYYRLKALDANGATMFGRPSGTWNDIKEETEQIKTAIETIEEDNAK